MIDHLTISIEKSDDDIEGRAAMQSLNIDFGERRIAAMSKHWVQSMR